MWGVCVCVGCVCVCVWYGVWGVNPHTHTHRPGLLELHYFLELSHDVILHNDLIQSSSRHHSTIKVLHTHTHTALCIYMMKKATLKLRSDKTVSPYGAHTLSELYKNLVFAQFSVSGL